MVNCEYCGADIIFGGVRVGKLRYCRRGCLKKAEEVEYRMGRARLHYEKCLARIREDPADPDVRKRALDAGRAYAAASRYRGGGSVTIYDEMSIANEIEAAGAAASGTREQLGEGSMSFEERLERLAALRAKNLITEEEYQEKRAEILAQL